PLANRFSSRRQVRMFRYWHVLKRAWREWNLDDASRQGAALAYYTVFALVPLLQVILSVIGLAFNQAEAQRHLGNQRSSWVGPELAKMMQSMVVDAHKPVTGVIGTVTGVLTIFLGTSAVLGELQGSLNRVWGVPKPDENLWATVRRRSTSFLY